MSHKKKDANKQTNKESGLNFSQNMLNVFSSPRMWNVNGQQRLFGKSIVFWVGSVVFRLCVWHLDI